MGSFLRLSADRIASLPKLLEARLPESCMIFNIVRLYLDKKFSPHIRTEFHAYNGDIDDMDKSFIVASQHRTFFSDIAITTSEASQSSHTPEMLQAFDSLVDWSKPLAFKSSYIPHMVNLCEKHGGKLDLYDPCFSFYMPIEDALQIEISPPTNVQVRQLPPNEAGRISKTWKFAKKGTPANMKDCIETVGSIGLFIDSECVSWIIHSTNGQFYALNVVKEFRGQGFGEITLLEMAKAAALKGLVPNGHVQLDNRVSFHLFEKVGFICSHAVEDIKYKPK